MHTPNKKLEIIQDLKFELLEHLPYRLDLAPSYFHMFRPLKDVTRGVHFSNKEEKNVVDSWFSMRPKIFLPSRITRLVEHWTKCIEKGGHYVEK
jgi:histone-lysine N-methyltransferase SETMAR